MKKIIAVLLAVSSLFLTACSSPDLYIGSNGNWWDGDKDLGIIAQGPQGPQGEQGVAGANGQDALAALGCANTISSLAVASTVLAVAAFVLRKKEN